MLIELNRFFNNLFDLLKLINFLVNWIKWVVVLLFFKLCIVLLSSILILFVFFNFLLLIERNLFDNCLNKFWKLVFLNVFWIKLLKFCLLIKFLILIFELNNLVFKFLLKFWFVNIFEIVLLINLVSIFLLFLISDLELIILINLSRFLF